MNAAISTATYQGVYDCMVQTGILDIAGLWNTGGVWYSYLNYSYNVPMISSTATWFTLAFGINDQRVLYTIVWSILLTFWITLYIFAFGAKTYNDSVYNFTWPNENNGGSIISPTKDNLGL